MAASMKLRMPVEIKRRLCDNGYHRSRFFELREGFISKPDEYWPDDGEAPLWRRNLNIGQPTGKIPVCRRM